MVITFSINPFFALHLKSKQKNGKESLGKMSVMMLRIVHELLYAFTNLTIKSLQTIIPISEKLIQNEQ